MKDSHTSTAQLPPDAAEARPVASQAGMAPHTLHGRCWLAVHLAALAGITTSLRLSAPPALLVGWSIFVLLNVVLQLSLRTGNRDGPERLATPTAAALGLAWGLGLGVLMPYADSTALAAMLSAALAVALFGIPVFGEQVIAYTYFFATLGLMTLGGVIYGGHHDGAILWVMLAMVTLQLVASSYFRTHRALRDTLRLVLGAEPPSATGTGVNTAQMLAHAARGVADLSGLRAQEARQRQTLDTLGDGLLTCDALGKIDYVNASAAALLGFDRAQLLGMPLEECVRIVHGRDPHNRTREIFEDVRLNRQVQAMSEQPQLLRMDGVAFGVDYLVAPLLDEHQQFTGVSLQLRDMTSRRQRTESVAWQASHDALTGIINRREFERRMHKLLQRMDGATNNLHTLLYIDIDKFKFINDTYGHAAGDHALRTLTDVLRTRIRGADTLARIGGDEFCALLYSCSAERARAIGESLRSAIDQHTFTWADIQLPVSISVGLVEIGPELRTTADLLRAADAACYSAKSFGRNRVQMFEPVTGEDVQREQRLEVVRDIQRALQDGRLDLFYQPLCATTTALPIDHCEVGVGIRTAGDVFIPRQEVVAVAARYQLSADIDRWLIKASIETLYSEQALLGDMRLVLIPLSAQSAADDRLLEYAIRMVRDHRAVASRLGFTLPEAVLASHPDLVRYFITTLKQDDCHFMIDDLGFGSDAIDAIKSMQVDYLGIRGCFVRNLLTSSVDYEVVLGLCRVARALGMKTVAGHADSRALRDALAKMGVDYAKGLLHDGPRRVARFDASMLTAKAE